MKTSRWLTVSVFLLIVGALSVSSQLHAQLGLENLTRQVQEAQNKLGDGMRGLQSSPHEDLPNCTVKDLTLSTASLQMNIKANCDGTDRHLLFMPADKDIAKLIYSEAMAAFLSNAKLNFQQVAKFEAGFFTAQNVSLSR